MTDQPTIVPGHIERIDRYTILVDGKRVRADAETEAQIRGLDAEARKRLLSILGQGEA